MLRDAAIQKALADAEAERPRAVLPGYCQRAVPHADIKLGESLEGLFKREQAQLNVANGVILDCAKFNRDP